ncbi:VirB4 family type IV secretion/conjugal transfer ATPase [Orientia tsutsugamushi]|uniref:VirB4 family type IV secretion/conjugal transfer ATPase n=1 Tax=Orientia tsutsugamushi TaxID=784 RepID=UPI0005F8A070|nr:VirB4 family type IV secretion/conjugal transfer ATPase [Orientia tsutsugamushi]KJV75390.1 type IV secretion/conjugal transfer ATPase, VirB4 family protein [Orientia tsutsugamushi str. TA763]SPP24922.1 VirB4 family type IV secretion/conjugal transfer ATPase [Orientia tsutsugamushi]
MKFFKTKVAREYYSKREVHVAKFIPYAYHWNKSTIITKKNELIKVIKISGFAFETADDQDLDIRKRLRNLLFKGMASGSLNLYFHIIRRRKQLASAMDEGDVDPTVGMAKDFVTYVDNEWKKKYSDFQSFINDIYITILYKPDVEGGEILKYFYNKLLQKSDKNAWMQSMNEMYANLDEMVSRVVTTFSDYDAQILKVKNEPHGVFCEILEFLATIVNCGSSMPVLLPRGSIDSYIPTHRLFFGDRSIEARGAGQRRYAGIVSIQEYGPKTSAGVLDSFLQLPFELIISQSFQFSSRTAAINKMQLQQNRMIQTEDKAVSQIAEISQALDMATSGEIGFGEHHLTVLCIADSLKALENALSIASVEIANTGMQPVREKVNLEAAYWAQLPGNIEYAVRKSVINTLNLAGFASMHNYLPGKAKGNHWGDSVTVLDTSSGTPFYFNFHVRDVGHTLLIGPTGAGKTVLMNFLCAQAQKFYPRTFFFDKDRGAEIFIRALDGKYTVINPFQQCNFNPLQLPDTNENRNFLVEWIKTLVTSNGESISADDMHYITLAVEGNYKLNPSDRYLSNIVAFLGIGGPDTLAGRIAMWHGTGAKAGIFDNIHDNMDLQSGRVFGFEMGELLKDPVSLAPVLLYLFHRINLSLDGSPTMIVLDEAWALIDNPVFAPKIKDWLKVLRKLNTFVIFATQSVEDASKSSISDTLIQQTATQIFLPNLKATDIYRTAFMLSEREFSIIKSTDPGSRYFLIKQGIGSVVAKLNLAGMNNIIGVLSGRVETVILLDQLRSEYGDDSRKWLPKFYKHLETAK